MSSDQRDISQPAYVMSPIYLKIADISHGGRYITDPGYPTRSRITSDPPKDALAWSRTIDPHASARRTSLLCNDQRETPEVSSLISTVSVTIDDTG